MENLRFKSAVFADNILKTPQHILICGATGAGKSTIEFELINSMLFMPVVPALFLIDPKCIDLNKYRKMRNVLEYVNDVTDAARVLNRACDVMEARYKRMQKNDIEICTDRILYVVIDELADLVLMDKSIFKPLQRILSKGRACNIFLLLCTQCVNREVLPTLLKQNINTTICGCCDNAVASRLILGIAGAEKLPKHGKVYIKNADGINLTDIPYIPREELQKVIDYWKK